MIFPKDDNYDEKKFMEEALEEIRFFKESGWGMEDDLYLEPLEVELKRTEANKDGQKS